MKPPWVGNGCRVTKVATGSRSSGKASSPTRRRPSAVCSSMSRRRAGRTVLAWILCAPTTLIEATQSSSPHHRKHGLIVGASSGGSSGCTPTTSDPAGRVPMPTVHQATHPISRPGNDMRYAGRHFLLTARAPEGPVRAGPADPTDEPLTVAVGLPARDPSYGTVQIELGALWTSAMSSGHGSSVGAEAASRLATEVAGGDEVLEQRRGGEPTLTELEIELTLDGEGDIETDRVEKLERAYRVSAAGLHGCVDLIDAGVVRLKHLHRVVEVGEEQGVDDGAGAVPAGHRMLADLPAQVLDRGHDVIRGRDCVNDLDELHDRGRVEEVHAHDILRALGHHGALDDRQREGGRGQDRARLADLVEVLEQRLLDLEILHDSLDHQVDLGQVLERRGAVQTPGDRIAVVVAELAPLDRLLQALGDGNLHHVDLGGRACNVRPV